MKVMSSKFPGRCKASGMSFPEGAEVYWMGKGKGCVLVAEARKSCERPVFADMLDLMLKQPRNSTQAGAVESFTVEECRGETYSEPGKWTLYAHSTYGRSSVLAGQNCRQYLRDLGSEEDAMTFMSSVPDWMPVDKIGGTTHVPVDTVVAHLDDGPDIW